MTDAFKVWRSWEHFWDKIKILSCSFKTQQSGPSSYFSNLYFFPCSITDILIFKISFVHTLFAHYFPTSKALSKCYCFIYLFILFTPTLFITFQFNLTLLYQDFAGSSHAQWTLISLKFCIPNFLNHLFGTYLAPSGISHFVACTQI